MSRFKILLIDDDDTLLGLLAEQVELAGYQAVRASHGIQGIRTAEAERPDLIVLDVMMPGLDGWAVIERVRHFSSTPIIMLTAKGDEVDKLRGFRLGVDDYISKPFSVAELVARVGAVLARTASRRDPEQAIASGDLKIDLSEKRVFRAQKEVSLSRTEFNLLAVLAKNAGHMISTERLLAEVWGEKYRGEVEHVKHYIWALRKKLEIDPGNPQHIVTERGFGYRFE